MNAADSLVDLVSKIEDALATVATKTKSAKLGLELSKAELHLKIGSKKSATIGGKLEFGVKIDLSAEKEWARAHTLTIELTPKKKVSLGKGESKQLAESILDLATAAHKIQKQSAGNFNVSEVSVSLEIEETLDGTVEVVVGGGSGERLNSHTITLTFRVE